MKDFIVYSFVCTVIVGFCIFLSMIRIDTTRDGEHTGFVTAIQKEGLFYKNYTIFFKTDNQSSQEDSYCVQEWDGNIADNLRDANKSRQLVTIHYTGVSGLGWNLCALQKITSFEVVR